jgi:hypothetical protein
MDENFSCVRCNGSGRVDVDGRRQWCDWCEGGGTWITRRYPMGEIFKTQVWMKTKGYCWYCGKFLGPIEERRFEIDHVHPVSKGGGTVYDNLVAACKQCNSRKFNKTLEEFRLEQHVHITRFWGEDHATGTTFIVRSQNRSKP